MAQATFFSPFEAGLTLVQATSDEVVLAGWASDRTMKDLRASIRSGEARIVRVKNSGDTVRQWVRVTGTHLLLEIAMWTKRSRWYEGD